MIGLLIVTHCDLGKELLNAARVHRWENRGSRHDRHHRNVRHGSPEKENRGEGRHPGQGRRVLILTDMFGGTPSNLSLSFLKEGKIEVLTGVNLPMIIAIVQNRLNFKVTVLAEKAQEAGKMGISLASKLLESP